MRRFLIPSVISISLSVAFLVAQAQAPDARQRKLDQVKENTLQNVRDTRQGARQEVKDTRQNVKQEVQDTRQNVREEARDVRQNVQGQVQQAREGASQNFQEKRAEAKKMMEDKRTEFKGMVEQKRAEAKSKIEVKRAEVKEKLQKVRDERKKQIAEKLYDSINQLNERKTAHFAKALDQIDTVLDRVASRTDKAEANGRGVSEVRSVMSAAHDAILAARQAVEAQAAKEYTFSVGDETTLKIDIGKARQALNADLKVVHTKVVEAREAVRKAATQLAQIPRVDELEVGPPPVPVSTSSPESVPAPAPESAPPSSPTP